MAATFVGAIALAHGSRVVGMADDPCSGMPTWQTLSVSP